MSEIEPMVQKFVLDTMAPKAKPMTSPPSVSAMGPFSATSSRSAVIVSFLPCAAEAYRTFADLNMGEQARAEAPGQPRAGGSASRGGTALAVFKFATAALLLHFRCARIAIRQGV